MLVPVSVSIEFHCMDKKVQLKKSEGTKTVELPTLVKKKINIHYIAKSINTPF